MADHPRHPDSDDDALARHERGPGTGSPWRQYALVLIAIVLVLGLVVLHLTGVFGPGTN
jgi:hypothetical protein